MVAGDGSGNELWSELVRKRLLECGIFEVDEVESEGPDGSRGRFIVLDARDWAIVVPRLSVEGTPHFLMVRQYRHGSGEISLEFPGGVVERGEDPAAAVARELEEETGFRARSIRSAGWTFPNPAFLSNRLHVFVAEGLEQSGTRALDEHELVDALLVPAAQVRERMGREPYSHALMAAALLMSDRIPRESS